MFENTYRACDSHSQWYIVAIFSSVIRVLLSYFVVGNDYFRPPQVTSAEVLT